MSLNPLGKILIITGVVLVIIGAVLMWFGKIPLPGKLPGDIVVRKRNLTIYFPIVTSVFLSIILSVILYFFNQVKK